MKIPVHIAEKLIQLSQGQTLPSSKAKHALIEELVRERIIIRKGRIQKALHLINPEALSIYLQNKYGIIDLEDYIEVSKKEDVIRSELVAVASNSKLRQIRTFKGFLINGFSAVQAMLNGKSTTLNFTDGIFQFIYDFEDFIPDPSVTIVGIENPENFRHIEKQKYLFKNIYPLFVSRYPQNQSKDLITWLGTISNPYLHFGDFDFAGIGIYMNEFKKHLGDKAMFFVPENMAELIRTHGNKTLYNEQKINFKVELIQEEDLLKLIEIIHQYRKGLEQEVLIQ